LCVLVLGVSGEDDKAGFENHTHREIFPTEQVARMSQRVGAKRRPMTGSAIGGIDGMTKTRMSRSLSSGGHERDPLARRNDMVKKSCEVTRAK
jgi:hypothetical protein